MSLAKQFSKKLDDLWRRRTAELRALVIPRATGQPKRFSKSMREKLIDEILEYATRILVKKEGTKEFNTVVRRRALKGIKGRGLRDRGNKLISWAEDNFRGPIVYAFWNKKKCLYVGKGRNWKRLKDYKKSAYLNEAKQIEVFTIKSKSHLGKVECLAVHLFNPRDNEYKPAKSKWGKSCPVCEKHDHIYDDLHELFRIR